MNQLFQQLNPTRIQLPNNIANIKQMMNSPQMKDVMNLVRNSNMSPKDLFYKMAKEKGVDPEEILRQLR